MAPPRKHTTPEEDAKRAKQRDRARANYLGRTKDPAKEGSWIKGYKAMKEKEKRGSTRGPISPVSEDDMNTCPSDPVSAVEWMKSVKRLHELKAKKKKGGKR